MGQLGCFNLQNYQKKTQETKITHKHLLSQYTYIDTEKLCYYHTTMYQPSSSSSSSQSSLGTTTTNNNNLSRYASAPGSFLSAAVDSVLGPHHHLYFSPATSDTTEKRSYGSDLIRQSSSPAGFFINHLANSGSNTASTPPAGAENGFSGPRSSNSKGGITRLNSQLSFTRQDSILSHISEEESENGVDEHGPNNEHIRKAANSYGNPGYGSCSWSDDPSNGIAFSSSPSSKRAKNINGDIHCLNREESQLQFGLHQSALEMAAMENLMQIPEDSVPCKIRAKRGCATHPRSIAERERRTRISGKLKKLQDLVPNMDKQTSYADMLDLAVQHIKGLQNHVQKLNSELENCTCGCNQTT